MTKASTFKRRLLKLAKFLETKVKKERFNMSCWVGDDWQGKQGLTCGTSACALGWATAIPEFRKAGLVMKRTRRTPRWDGESAYVGFVGLKNKPRSNPNSASLEVFGLDDNEHKILFESSWDSNPKQKASEIRRFVKEKYGR